jgi:hypothetical protein
MKSEIKIDFIDRGTGVGIEPVIRVELKNSDDPRDTLIAVLFEGMQGQQYIQFDCTRCNHVPTPTGLPELEKQYLLFKPEVNLDDLFKYLPENIWLIKDEHGKTHISERGSGSQSEI